MIAIDYLGGGSGVEFHVLTWVTTGACFVAQDLAPCWGATVLSLSASAAEGGVNASPISADDNPISGVELKAGQFAEFGINLSDAGIFPSGACAGFSQTIWESRSSGSSFVSSTKDITIEDNDINICGSATVTKVGSDGGSQEGAVFTLYQGSDTTGTVVGTCTVNAAGECVNDGGTTTYPPSFANLQPGTYTIDETTVPANYGKDPDLPETFTVDVGEAVSLSYTDPRLAGALKILKNSTKGGAVANAGAVFSYDGSSVTDNGTGDEDLTIGVVCVSASISDPIRSTRRHHRPGTAATPAEHRASPSWTGQTAVQIRREPERRQRSRTRRSRTSRFASATVALGRRCSRRPSIATTQREPPARPTQPTGTTP